MNIIHCPTLSITVSETSAIKTVRAFVEELASRNRFLLDRIYSYMAQDFLPTNPNASSHIVAKRRDAWVENGYAGGGKYERLQQMNNGWYLFVNADPSQFANSILQRIEEVLQQGGVEIKIYAYLESNRKPGIRYYSEKDIEQFKTPLVNESVTIAEERTLSKRSQTLYAFWQGFNTYLENHPELPQTRANRLPREHYEYGCVLNNRWISRRRVIRSNTVNIGVQLNTEFDSFLQRKETIEQITGPLDWNETKKTVRAVRQHTTDEDAYQWLGEMTSTFAQVFGTAKKIKIGKKNEHV